MSVQQKSEGMWHFLSMAVTKKNSFSSYDEFGSGGMLNKPDKLAESPITVPRQ
jgi:hypothetical protein